MMLYFSHDAARKVQEDLIKEVQASVAHGGHLLVNAPTGLGKTAAALSPAFSHAMESDMTVFFLTSRHTQHRIAIETLRQIKRRHNLSFAAIDVVGKKHMCAQPGIEKLPSRDFAEYCKALREDELCEYYKNLIKENKVTAKGAALIQQVKSEPMHAEQIASASQGSQLCPYYLTNLLAAEAKVIITDYYYVFNPDIAENFFAKNKKEMAKSIIIVDEAHNLPDRARNLLSERLTTVMIARAVKEAKKYNERECLELLDKVQQGILRMAKNMQQFSEAKISKDVFVTMIGGADLMERMRTLFELAAVKIREDQKYSSMGSIAGFLEAWGGDDAGFLRYIKVEPQRISVVYNCLDPSVITRPVFKEAYACILMSATLQPLEMYRDLLGIDAKMLTYDSPFKKANRLNLIVPLATTKFEKRSDIEYKKIAGILAGIANTVPGNTLAVFPSYKLRDEVSKYFDTLCMRTIFKEDSLMTKEEKAQLLERFAQYKDSGAILMGAISGSFAEGIDMPGVVKCVVVIGLPLQQPDLETKELINYYEMKYQKGWDYGYVLPAFTKTFQAAGRCVRTEKDRGVIVFLDERFLWPNYHRHFPKDWDTRISKDYLKDIDGFFTAAAAEDARAPK